MRCRAVNRSKGVEGTRCRKPVSQDRRGVLCDFHLWMERDGIEIETVPPDPGGHPRQESS